MPVAYEHRLASEPNSAIVRRDGTLCAMVFSGGAATDQWLGSRGIAAEKRAPPTLSASNRWRYPPPISNGGATRRISVWTPHDRRGVPQGHGNRGLHQFGTGSDPMLGKRTGGIVVFGGGLALYDGQNLVGGLGMSVDTSCADHNVAWRVRHALNLDHAPPGPTPNKTDAISMTLMRTEPPNLVSAIPNAGISRLKLRPRSALA
jgi:hypothetical protein